MDSRDQDAHHRHEAAVRKPPDRLDEGIADGAGKDEPLYGTGALLRPQRTYGEGLFRPGNGAGPGGVSGDCGQQIPAASERGTAGSRGNGGYCLFR
ncbi:hypothetical protein CIRMBP1230_00892 [Enterococcus cecorum]|nr:hypothetical protein CIRMBP1230_00892 [Enterococcus cecorum]CAI3351475.1 hypothetical protein CIRMBP1229_00969 [Enterococcus cecorum]